MTSVLVSEVNHLSHAHQRHHDARRSHSPHHPYPSRTNAPHTGPLSQAASSMDAPMTDAASQTQTPATATSSSSSTATPRSHTSGLAPSAAAAASHGCSTGPPPSPRFQGRSEPSQHITTPSSAPPPAPAAGSDASCSASISQQKASSPLKIKVKSLSHIQSFVLDEQSPLSKSSSRLRRDAPDVAPQYEISEMPVTDIIEMVAGLLTKITATNDKQHQHLHRQIPSADGPHGMSPQTTSVLAFHGKNVPSISILSYLSRIHKYCPTTYEVFLSLLVYFDRMTERVNAGPMQDLKEHSEQQHQVDSEHEHSDGMRSSPASSSALAPAYPEEPKEAHRRTAPTSTPPSSGHLGKAPPAQDSGHSTPPSPPVVAEPGEEPYNFSHFFVVDSFNIHRLVIAGVTCASKFFSDIFYTNSRYAKVGGLPLPELNHLELQFLLLNDFRLAVPLEEMEAYGTMLVEFYAREVLADRPSLTASNA